MGNPVCSKSLAEYAREQEGKVWTSENTQVVTNHIDAVLDDLKKIQQLAQQAAGLQPW